MALGKAWSKNEQDGSMPASLGGLGMNFFGLLGGLDSANQAVQLALGQT